MMWQKRRRNSNRLRGYDYASAGAYFVTICARDKACLFGEIIESQIQLNKAGKLVYNWWIELINKFKNIELDMFIIMPNHIHKIIIIIGAQPHLNKFQFIFKTHWIISGERRRSQG